MGSTRSPKDVRRKLPTVKTFSHDNIKTTIYVKSSSPYISIVKRTNKFLQELGKRKKEYVTLLGMGKAIFKTLSVATHFSSLGDYKVDIFTKTLNVLDEVYADNGKDEDGNDILSEDREVRLSSRTISGVEVRISII
ncbi:ribonucleases P/MRP protein subunit POP7 [Kluyveromyces marxianus]|uniref:Ribonucleases P/MRP protein subunit POP7 n=2 Tax=Kluyveromyces marxianus TaxID=4911 RepID=W0T5W4_KLUMD|nr:ribonucleases P/MRP protein subunit POP7 [Kluyveromyces marxianus DMKU3-1042]QGN13388.1 ribonucleases P/MRP protein subunit POP7 [Kluyveromyces marxianus]BAO38438.1 ribonucleases P/MRP protein subunit POP7 [Kluyveromyces marxianus DMKU3-1042]BAP69991.1 ribonucleases P/MRP protein subunit POP7 [Kluyveromyces marxianus]